MVRSIDNDRFSMWSFTLLLPSFRFLPYRDVHHVFNFRQPTKAKCARYCQYFQKRHFFLICFVHSLFQMLVTLTNIENSSGNQQKQNGTTFLTPTLRTSRSPSSAFPCSARKCTSVDRNTLQLPSFVIAQQHNRTTSPSSPRNIQDRYVMCCHVIFLLTSYDGGEKPEGR